jgi:class 3 adenylate cyclase/TolB-like protein/tetratricopeptide (TPR) repeat protein
METPRYRLAAVWFADVVGYTRQAAEDEERAVRVVRSFQDAARDVTQRHEGRIVKLLGDGVLAEFASTEAAVRAALRLKRASVERSAHAGVDCPTLRIGLHVGDVMTTPDGDVYGDGVNLASRLADAAEPGEVWVSQDVWRQLRHRPRFSFQPRGARELEGFEAVEVYAVASEEGEEGEESAVAGVKARAKALLRELGRRPARPAVVAIGILIAVAAWSILRPGEPPGGETGGDLAVASATLDPSRVAVLYFEDHSEGRRLGYLADGLTEGLIHDLTQIAELDVVSREGVKPYRDASTPLDSIAHALGAGTIVEGSVEESGDIVRVTAQLIDASDGTHLTSVKVERPRGELFALQDELVAEVSRGLRRRLGEEIRLELSRRATRSVEGWELVQRAEALRDQARTTRDDAVATALRREADSLLVRAETLEPRWIEPILLRGRLSLEEGSAEALERGFGHTARAIALTPRDARALALRGTIQYRLAEQASDSIGAAELLVRAEQDLRTAVAADPTLATAWISLADLLYNGKWDLVPAYEAAQRAYAEDAFLLEQHHFEWLSEIALQLERYDEALHWIEEGRRRYPAWLTLLGIEIAILASRDGPEPDAAAAWDLVEQVDDLAPQESRSLFGAVMRMQVATVLAREGRRDSALAVARRARNQVTDENEGAFLDYYDAYLRLALNRRDAAIPLLRSFLTTYPEHRAQVARDHWFEELAGDPRFEELVDRRRLPFFCQILCEPPP